MDAASRRHFWLIGVVFLFLVSCSGPLVRSEATDIRAGAEDTLAVVSQALSVSDRMNWGMQLQTLSSLHLHTLRTVDLDGEPFIDITISTPRAADSFWDVAFSVAGDEWDPDDHGSAWTTTLTGASTARDTLIVSNIGLSLPMRLARTVEALGGLDNVTEVVAIEQQTFVVRDAAGALWDTYTQEPLPNDLVGQLEEMYREMVVENSNSETAARLKAAWAEVMSEDRALGVAAQSGSRARLKISEVSTPDGTLDAARMAELLEQRSYALEPLVVNPEQRTCVLFICNRLRTGYIPSSHQALNDGFMQYPSQLGGGPGFRMPYCIANSSVYQNAPIGCGPAAFMGVIQRMFVNGQGFFGKTYSGSRNLSHSELRNHADVVSMTRELTAPIGMNGRPNIANYMGTCWNTGGSMTIGAAYRDGAIAFLRDQKVNRTVVSNISHYTGNVTSAPAKADILIRNIGQRDNPVVALYFRGVGQGHYSPVTSYAVYDTGANGLNVQTLSDAQWMSLSGTWGTERGVFAIE